MVLVGGATRLTKSGLSITQWKPVTGVVPRLSATDWQAEFDRYKRIPQFAELNPDMTLAGFKTIFWWEWSHRSPGADRGCREFILPALWFWLRGQFKGALGREVLVATGLLALEPIVGWWMVSSGLSERTEVAQDRLALHLLIAAGVFGALICAAVGLGDHKRASEPRGFVAAAAAFTCPHLLPAGLRRARSRLEGRAHLQHLAADGLGPCSRRSLPSAVAARAHRRPDDGAVRPPDGRLRRPRLRVRSGDGGASLGAARADGGASLGAARARPTRGGSRRRRDAASRAPDHDAAVGRPDRARAGHQAMALVLFGVAVAHWRRTRMEQACQ